MRGADEGEVNVNGLLVWLLRVRVRVFDCIGFVDIIAFFLVAVRNCCGVESWGWDGVKSIG